MRNTKPLRFEPLARSCRRVAFPETELGPKLTCESITLFSIITLLLLRYYRPRRLGFHYLPGNISEHDDMMPGRKRPGIDQITDFLKVTLRTLDRQFHVAGLREKNYDAYHA